MASSSKAPEVTKGRVERFEAARRRRVEIAVANPVFFGEYYVRYLDENWTGPLPAIACDMLGFVKSVRRGVLMTPPEFLKTTIVSQLYPLWLTFRYAALGRIALLTGMLLSEEQDLAERNLSVTTWHIENNDRLQADFIDGSGRPLVVPDLAEDKWTDSAIVVQRPGVSKDPTWQAKGLNSQGIQGARLRHLIGDDVVTPRSADSPAIQRKAKRLWDTQVTTRVLERGQAVIAGNFNHPKDLLSDLAAKPAYALMKRPALHVPGHITEAPKNPRQRDVVPALPERWSRLRLLRELAEKPGTFAQVYLLRAGEEGGTLLRSEWVTRIAVSDIPTAGGIVYLIAVDPAPGSETDPDPSFFTITVGALTDRHLDVVESFADRIEPTMQVRVLADTVTRYQKLGHVGGIAVAKISLDRYFRGAVEVGHPALRPLLHEVPLPGDKSKVDRLAHLGAYTRSGWCRILESAWTATTSGPDHRDYEESLAEQWTALPNQNHDDRLDGVDVLIREALERMGTGSDTVASTEGSGVTDDLHNKAM